MGNILAQDLPQSRQEGAGTSPSLGSTGPTGDLTDSVMRTLVSNGKDALRLLFQAAIEHVKQDGTTPSNPPSVSRHPLHSGAEIVTPQTTASMRTSRPIYLSPASPDALTVWRAFRFVKMGWFTAEEAVTYMEL